MEAATQATTASDAEIDMGGSRGCIATDYLQLFDIAKLQRPSNLFEMIKKTNLQEATYIHYPNYKEGLQVL